MAVMVRIKSCGGEITGKFAEIRGNRVDLFLDAMPDKQGGLRGCGKRLPFSAVEVEVVADQPELEIRYRKPSGPGGLLRAGYKALSLLMGRALSCL